ncbi:MAG: hypothetical protein HY651_05210 [Acidobacteria bacterium]|nr:hypothetical protein [Acidobacteriota bacterium]
MVNEPLGWGAVLASLAMGIYMGQKFQREDWLGGYGSFPRRMVRLAHIPPATGASSKSTAPHFASPAVRPLRYSRKRSPGLRRLHRMKFSSNINLLAVLTALLSLLMGAAAIVWADFGMPGWFFVLTQIWFWTAGLPTMLGVLAVTAMWGIPGWTALPVWVFASCATIVSLLFQTGSFFLLSWGWRRVARGQS